MLDRTLHQLVRLRIPPGSSWELLVVENACTDDTPAVVRSYADLLPIVPLVEPALGIAIARNRALVSARGELLLFVDDDVLVDENWLVNYVAAAARWPEAGFFAGLIEPLYEHEPPAWFRANERMLAGFLGARPELGDRERWLAPKELPYGANMGFRRSAFESRRFRSDIGRRGRQRMDSEDCEFGAQLVKTGVRGVWIPSARVQHVVGREQLTLSRVRGNFVGQARTILALEGWDTEGANLFWGMPRWLILAAAQAQVRSAWRLLTRHPHWFGSFIEAARVWGRMIEYWHHHRGESQLSSADVPSNVVS